VVIDDADAREQPLKFLQQKVPVFEKPEHAQVHADAANHQPRREWRPFALAIRLPSQKSIAVVEKSRAANGGFQPRRKCSSRPQEIFSRIPGTHAPVHAHDDCKKTTNVSELKSMAARDCLSKKACWWPVHFSRSFCGIDSDLATKDKIEAVIKSVLEK
jgi:hypothetical protein